MCSRTSKVTPTDMKIQENSHTKKNVKYCAKGMNRKCFYLPFTCHIFILLDDDVPPEAKGQ